MAAAVAAIRNRSRPQVKSKRRHDAYERQDQFSNDVLESKEAASLKKAMAFDADHSGGLDAVELKKMIQSLGRGHYLDSSGKQLDFMHSAGGKHHPSDPTDSEIAWIMKSFAKTQDSVLIGKEILLALVVLRFLPSYFPS